MKIKFKVLGRKWKLILYTKEEFNKKRGNAHVGETDVNKRRIYLRPDGFDLETVIHELIHAYLGEMCLNSSDLDGAAMEEICCEMFSKRGADILRMATKLYSQVKKLTGQTK
jgi:hypothetical protein